jgi:hypothetical protein
MQLDARTTRLFVKKNYKFLLQLRYYKDTLQSFTYSELELVPK